MSAIDRLPRGAAWALFMRLQPRYGALRRKGRHQDAGRLLDVLGLLLDKDGRDDQR